MRIDLLAPPMSGHLHPVLALARELSSSADVRVLSSAGVQDDIAAAGLRGDKLLDAEADAAVRRLVDPGRPIGSHPLRLWAQFQEALHLQAAVYHRLCDRYAQSPPDLVIADFTLATAGAACDRYGVRWWTSQPSPSAMECADGPPGYLGGLLPAADPLTRAWHWLGRRATRGFKRGVAWSCRGTLRPMGLPGPYRADGSERIYSRERVLLLGVPELEFATRWPAAAVFVGPALYTPPSAHPDPPFVSGARHVLVTFGTHLRWARSQMQVIARTLARALPDVQIHTSRGEATDHAVDAADTPHGNLVRLPFVHYEQHLPRYDVVVHHGGAGILYHCLRAGRPSVVLPCDYDQFDHAARLSHRDAAVWARTPDAVTGHVRQLLTGDRRLAGLPSLQAAVCKAIAARDMAAMVRT